MSPCQTYEKRPREQLYCTTHAGYLEVQAYNLAACFPHTHRNISGTRWEPEPWAPSCVANKQTFGAMHHFRNDAKQGSVCQQKLRADVYQQSRWLTPKSKW